METQTILIVINLVLTVVISPLIEVLKVFVKNIKRSKCFNSEVTLSRENTPEITNVTKQQNIEDIQEIIKRLSTNKNIAL